MDTVTATLDDSVTLRAPDHVTTRLASAVIALSPAGPNWIATDDRGARLLALFDGAVGATLGYVLARWKNPLHVDQRPDRAVSRGGREISGTILGTGRFS